MHLNITDKDSLTIKPDENSGVTWFHLDEAIKASCEPWYKKRIYQKLNKKLEKLI